MSKDNNIKKYKKRLIKDFYVENIDKINNYENLLDEMERQYKSIINNDLNKLFLERVKVEDRINLDNGKSVKDVILVVSSMIYSVFVVVIGKLDSYELMNDASVLLHLTYIVAGIFIVNLIISYNDDKYRRGYNLMCTTVLEKIKKEIEENNNGSKVQNDLNAIKRFIGI